MMDRWQVRWANNLARYNDLTCMKVILPWSTPSMRFCTSELKAKVIASALKKRFPAHHILNVTGIRREESSIRAKMPVSAINSDIAKKGYQALTWNAIIEWTKVQARAKIAHAGLALHEAYTKFKMTRVSCVYCIMSSAADLVASAKCEDNQDVYVEMVELEAASTFAFQGGKWLADVAPHLLSQDLKDRVAQAKLAAQIRQQVEERIPKRLLYTKGWPTVIPTFDEACVIAQVRIEIAQALGIDIGYTTPESIIERFSELTAMKTLKDLAAGSKADKAQRKKQAKAEMAFDKELASETA